MITAGSERLAEELSHQTQQALADRLDVDQATISLWKSGGARPQSHHRTALFLLFGIPEEDWWTDEERALIAKIEAQLTAEKKPVRRWARRRSARDPARRGARQEGSAKKIEGANRVGASRTKREKLS